ncbi:nicotinate phosphoribosyltransferase [Mycoplasma sp. SG1]|uniref:nicotinate phosphoribosyltransferase n=1 Tax=Mycoplasma sp. SG1 TaxID=2810348 RepID=UPI00202450FE|nr:nicotinate phosphoribosyltransferase [Mycoplasma sp. SG1]URM52807.1 nicotinate phosphoribosyltransferase [Mycoplasma sp. SG1]
MIKYPSQSSLYFHHAAIIAEKVKKNTIVTVQYFQPSLDNVMLVGIKEALKILEKYTDTSKLKIQYIEEGTIIQRNEPVLKITGPYHLFGYLENMIDSVLTRGSSVATNVQKIINLVGPNRLIIMSDRGDHYDNLARDGYAAAVAGATMFSNYEQLKLISDKQRETCKVFGSVPHALIQLFNDDVNDVVKNYAEIINEKLIILVDFDNDIINTTLKVMENHHQNLIGVRVDTSPRIIDKYFYENGYLKEAKFDPKYSGSNPILISALRKALDNNGYQNQKIIISSGLTYEKIKYFEDHKTKIDGYGVGLSLLKVNVIFTCDAVKLNDKPLAKFGRKEYFSKQLKIYIPPKTLK